MKKILFRYVPLGRLLIIVYAVLLIFIAVVRFVEYKQTRQAVNKIHTIAENTNQELKILTAISSNHDSVKKLLLQFYHTGSEGIYADSRYINPALYINESYFSAFSKLTRTHEERMILNELVILNHETKQLIDSLFKSASSKKSLVQLIERQKDVFENFDNSLHRLLEVVSNESEKAISAINTYILTLARRKELSSYFFISLLLALGLTIGNTLRKLKRTENKYRLLFDLSPLPTYFVDVVGLNILEVNRAAVNKYGYSKEEFLRMTIFELRNVRERKLLKKITDSHSGEGNIFEGKVVHYKKNGRAMHVEIISHTIVLENKKVFLVTINDVTKKEKLEKKITQAIIKTQEDERQKLGSELHDNIGQILVSTQLFLSLVMKTEHDKKEKYLSETRKYLTLAINEIRNISHRVFPAFLEKISFPEAISNLLNGMNPDGNLTIRFEYDSFLLTEFISPDIKLNIYRILQEQLKNIQKYSKATEINIELRTKDNWIHLKITDNGIGFDLNKVKPGIGILNMQKRAELFSGKFLIDTTPSMGCSVMVEFPLLTDKVA